MNMKEVSKSSENTRMSPKDRLRNNITVQESYGFSRITISIEDAKIILAALDKL